MYTLVYWRYRQLLKLENEDLEYLLNTAEVWQETNYAYCEAILDEEGKVVVNEP